MSNSVAQIAALISSMSVTELTVVNRMVCDQIRHFNAMKQMTAATKFNVGQSVTFTNKFGLKAYGKITKINAKTIQVDAGIDGRWRISPSLLSAV